MTDDYLQQIENFFNAWADLMWSTPLVVLLVGGGLFFMIRSRGAALSLFWPCYCTAAVASTVIPMILGIFPTHRLCLQRFLAPLV